MDQSRGFTKEGRGKGVDADRVAQAVEHALTARRPKARYLVGPDAKMSGHVRHPPARSGARSLRRPERSALGTQRSQARPLIRDGRHRRSSRTHRRRTLPAGVRRRRSGAGAADDAGDARLRRVRQPRRRPTSTTTCGASACRAPWRSASHAVETCRSSSSGRSEARVCTSSSSPPTAPARIISASSSTTSTRWSRARPASGFANLMGGQFGSLRFCYLDTWDALGLYAELVEDPDAMMASIMPWR